jgi:hypothetical protein
MMEIFFPSLCDMFENQRINGVKQIFISGIKKLIISWCHNFLNKFNLPSWHFFNNIGSVH